MKYSRFQRGIALVQVLMLSAIMSVILLSFAQQAKTSVDIAEAALQKSIARLELETVQSNLELQLVTKNKTVALDYGFFNFFSEPFGWFGVQIKVQDMSSLFTLNPHSNTNLDKLLEVLGSSQREAQELTAALADWQDADNEPGSNGAEQDAYPNLISVRNAPFPVLQEVKFVKGFSKFSGLSDFFNVTTLYPNSHFNPMNAPEKILAIYVRDPSRIKAILDLRTTNKLSSELFSKLSGIETTDRTMLSPGQAYRLDITYEKNGVKAQRVVEIIVKPYAKDPIANWQIKNTQ